MNRPFDEQKYEIDRGWKAADGKLFDDWSSFYIYQRRQLFSKAYSETKKIAHDESSFYIESWRVLNWLDSIDPDLVNQIITKYINAKDSEKAAVTETEDRPTTDT